MVAIEALLRIFNAVPVTCTAGSINSFGGVYEFPHRVYLKYTA
jgi:hypothetical protein